MPRLPPTLLRFYAAVALLTLFDNAVVTAIIWLSLSVTQSTVPLGLVLCLSIALPFAFEQLFARRQQVLSMKQLAAIRVAVFLALAALSALGAGGALLGFLLLALAVGVVDFFTVSVFESRNAELVVEGQISANHAARWMQTAVQLGGFAGAFLGGVLLDSWGGNNFLTMIGVSSAIATFVLRIWTLGAAKSTLATAAQDKPTGEAVGAPEPQGLGGAIGLRLGRNKVTALLIGLGLVGLHIGAFNSMLPLNYREVHGWDAASFGFASAVAGLGAFLAASVPSLPGKRSLVALVFVAADALLVFSGSIEFSSGAAFVLGFVTNLLRIHMREHLINAARTPLEASWIGSRSAYAALSMQAMAPLVLSLLASQTLLASAASGWLMVMSGVAVLIGMVGIDLYYGAVRGPRVVPGQTTPPVGTD